MLTSRFEQDKNKLGSLAQLVQLIINWDEKTQLIQFHFIL